MLAGSDQRQIEGEGGALLRGRPHPDLTAVPQHDLTDDVETEADAPLERPRLLSSLEGLEEACDEVRWDGGSVVVHRELRPSFGGGDADRDRHLRVSVLE